MAASPKLWIGSVRRAGYRSPTIMWQSRLAAAFFCRKMSKNFCSTSILICQIRVVELGQKVDSLELNLSHSSPSGCQDGLFANDNILTVVEIISLRGMDSRETMWGEISRGEIFDGRCNWIEWLSSEIFDRRMFSNIWLDISYNQIFGYLRMFLNIFTLLYASLSVIDWWCWTAGLKRQRWHHQDEV